MLVVNIPLSKSADKQLQNNSAMLGYKSVEEFSDVNSLLLDASQLFPQGMITLSAIKIFSDTRIDEAIVEAASLTNQANSILKYMFYDIIAGKTEMLNPVESYIYEDSMGLCGWINNKRVLLGNRELMINHSIEGLPSLTREKDYTENGKVAVYLSISGELSAMFVIEITTNNEVKHWLQECEANDIYVMLRSVDSIISISKLSELFDVNPDMFKLIPFRLHQKFDDTTTFASRQSGSMCCTGKFSSFASLLISAKRVKKTAMLGVSIQVAAIALGIILSMVMTIISSFTEINISLALIYNFIWFFITLFLQGMRKV